MPPIPYGVEINSGMVVRHDVDGVLFEVEDARRKMADSDVSQALGGLSINIRQLEGGALPVGTTWAADEADFREGFSIDNGSIELNLQSPLITMMKRNPEKEDEPVPAVTPEAVTRLGEELFGQGSGRRIADETMRNLQRNRVHDEFADWVLIDPSWSGGRVRGLQADYLGVVLELSRSNALSSRYSFSTNAEQLLLELVKQVTAKPEKPAS